MSFLFRDSNRSKGFQLNIGSRQNTVVTTEPTGLLTNPKRLNFFAVTLRFIVSAKAWHISTLGILKRSLKLYY